MEASDWLLKIDGREIDDRRSKNSSKMLISLTSSATCDHIFRSHDGTSKSVGKGSGIFGNLRKSSEIFGKARGKKEGRGGWGKERRKNEGRGWRGKDKKVWRVGWVMTSSKK